MRRSITTGELTWIDIADPSRQEIESLSQEFPFHQIDMQELQRASPRPHVEEHPGYLFFVVHIPVYNGQTRATKPLEVDIFVTHTHVITVHRQQVHVLDHFFRNIEEDKTSRERYVGRGAAYLLYSLFDQFIETSFPKLDHIIEKLEVAEKRIFAGEERSMVLELSAIERDLSGFRAIVRPQVHLYDAGTLHGDFATPLFKAVFRSINAKLARVWDTLETLRERVRALSHTNSTLLTHKLNEFIKLLTLLGAVFIPFGLIAQVVMFIDGDEPLAHLVIFWSIVTVMLLVDFVLLWNARQRKLL